MERPFQFTDDRDGARSPFNQQLLNPITQPTNFKTNVNRSKTRKWTEAKNYSYDGDDWGGYDPYDEYGSYDDNQGPPPAASSAAAAAAAPPPRRNSFETGDESAAFSSGVPRPPSSHTTPTKPHDDYAIRRDFSQLVHVPPPLQTRTSPQAVRERYPARKSSLPSSPAQAQQQPATEQAASPSASKPRPFVRPADIYKRIEEERLKEQGKSPVEALPVVHRAEHEGFTVENPVLAQAIGADVAASDSPTASARTNAGLPPVNRVASGFGSEFWKASELSDQPHPTGAAEPAAVESAPSMQHQSSLGLRAAVTQAFDRQDDSSVPPTPISRDDSQSRHGSETSGISPIMSRVPSAATAEAKARIAESRVPPIAEESSVPASPSSRPSSKAQSVMRKPSPSHSRNVSSGSLSDSPARTPQLEFTKRLSTPMAAETTSLDDELTRSPVASPSHPVTSVRVIAPSADYTQRESDIAAEVSSSSPSDSVEAAHAAQAARAQFLQTHHTPVESPSSTSPVLRATSPVMRRESPGPGRVRDLAGKYNDLHNLSRSNSAMSFSSKNSDNLSLKRSGTYESKYSDDMDGTGDAKPEELNGGTAPRPDASRGLSFRPHLPGEWVSFVGTPAAEKPATQDTGESMIAGGDELSAPQPEIDTPRAPSRSTEDFDLTPSTVKQPLPHKDVAPKESSPIDAVRAAGDALGAALMSSFGQNHEARDFAQVEAPQDETPEPQESAHRPSVGDIYLRPLAVERTASSIASSIGSTPPPKDTPEGLNLNRSSGYFPPPMLRLDSDAISPASDYSHADLESDRLRREIERSLTPQIPVNTEDQQTRDQDALDAPENLREVQKSDGLPLLNSQPVTSPHVVFEEPKTDPPDSDKTPQVTSSKGPGLLDKRFSWEQGKSSSGLFGDAGDDAEPRASYERPKSSAGLHVVNTDVSVSSSSASSVNDTTEEAIEETAPLESVLSPISPVTSPDLPAALAEREQTIDTVAAPPAEFPTEVEKSTEQSLFGPSAEPETASVPAPSGTAARIPPFREILALRSAHERIDTYNSTRDQFASMDTGLQNWLSSSFSAHPEHAHLITDANNKPSATTTLGSIRYKHQPSIMKIAKGLGASSREPSGSYTADPSEAASGVERQNSQGRSPSQHHGGVEKMQTKGKDLLHSAGMLGGKATFGAKGLFAKAKGKLREGGGSEKAPQRTPTPNALASPTSIEPPESALSQETSGNKTAENKNRDRSRSNNRFSTAFGRFGTGYSGHPSSRPSSIALSPSEGPHVVVSPSSERAPTPLALSGDAEVIAPWAEEKEGVLDAKELENERFKRIGLLPSPAYGSSMASQESNEHAPEEGRDSVAKSGTEKEVPHNEQALVGVSEQHISTAPDAPRDASMLAKDSAAVGDEDFGAALADSQTLPGPSLSAMGNSVETEVAPVTAAVMAHGPREDVSEVQPVSRRSSVSSLGPDDKGLPTGQAELERSVSPLPMEPPSELPSVAKRSERDDQEESEDLARPPLVGRSSLPSQQRPQESRQASWTWKGSRTSLAQLGEDSSALPVKGRSGSAQWGSRPGSRPPSRPGSRPVSRAASPASFLEMAPAQKQRNAPVVGAYATDGAEATPEEIAESPVEEPMPGIAIAQPAHGTGQVSPAPIMQSPIEMQPPQQQDMYYASHMPPMSIDPAMVYTQPWNMSREHVIPEDPRDHQFSPAIMDPRQQAVEYQLPGVGPPEDAQGSRRSRRFMSPVHHSPAPVERINPAAMAMNHQRTFSGDEIPQTQAAMEKKEKRRSGMFGTFSRNSSYSGLSDGKQGRGSVVTNTPPAELQQQQDSAAIAAQKAREASGGSLKGNTLKKMQRSSTTAGTPDPEKKNKRFSRLGSIFGRSNSDARKGNKLVKSMPKGQAEAIPEVAAAKRAQDRPPQDVPPLPHLQYGSYGDNSQQQWQQSEQEPSSMPPPPGGWYAPTSRRSSYNGDLQPTLPQLQPTESPQSWQQQQQSTQPTRRLHSEGFRHEPRRAISPSPLRGQRMSQQYEPPANYQRVPSWGPRQYAAQPHAARNFSWGSQAEHGGYFPDSPVKQRTSPAHTPTHSRHASFNSMTGTSPLGPPPQGPPPPRPSPQMFRNGSSGQLQQASSPALYGQSQPYQVPAPVTEGQQMDWGYGDYVPAPGPAQQASHPGMYARGYSGSGSRPGSANARVNGMTGMEGYGAGGMASPQQSPVRPGPGRYYGGRASGPRPYPGGNQQQGERTQQY